MGTSCTTPKSECANSSRSYGENGAKKGGNFGLGNPEQILRSKELNQPFRRTVPFREFFQSVKADLAC
jgi:hypothetical protein